MNRVLFVCLLAFWFHLLRAIQAAGRNGITDAEVYYSGRGPACEPKQCESGLFYFDSYECDSSSSWNNGSGSFADPIGPGNQITIITLILSGVFGCGSVPPKVPQVHVYLQDVLFGTLQVNTRQTNCSCLNCVSEISFNRFVPGWPGYVYGGLNAIRVVGEGLPTCISCIGLLFTYQADSTLTSSSSSSSGNSSASATLTSSSGLSATTDFSTTNNGSNVPPDQQHSLIVVGAVMLSGMVFVNMCVVGGWYAMKRKPENGNTEADSEAGAAGAGPGSPGVLDKALYFEDIEIGERIGRGSFGEVYIGKWYQTTVAVKKLPMEMLRANAAVLDEFNREINLLRSLRHPNILQFLGSCHIPPNICLITEYMPKGDLHKIIHDKSVALDKHLMKRIALDVARGMLYLHSSIPVVIHRDLKSHNVLIGEYWTAKVADFGLSKIIQSWEETSKYTPCGTPKWAAPEVLRNEIYSTKADVYSFAIILWEMTTRLDPFPGMTAFELIVKVGKHGLRPGSLTDSNPLAQLISECWENNSKLRPTFERIITILEGW